MKALTTVTFALAISLSIASCGSGDANTARSTQIDSSNVNGTAPADYSGANPTHNTDTNVNDTGTKANTVHNTGY